MAHILKRRRLVNPRRRRMTPEQAIHFGTKRQRAAAWKKLSGRRNKGFQRAYRKAKAIGGKSPQYEYKLRKHQWRHGKRFEPHRYGNQGDILGAGTGLITRAEHAAERAIQKVEHAAEQALHGVTSRLNRGRTNRGRRKNVGEILTVMPANPGRRRRRSSMYRTHNRRRHNRRRRMGVAEYNRRYHNPRRHNRRRYHNRRRRHNPTIVRYHNARRHHYMHNRRRRRNPGFTTGTTGAIVGILGGAAITKIITGFLPTTFTTGFMGMAATGVGAVVAGQIAGRVSKNRQFGNWVMIGGLLIVALELVNQFIPGLQLPFGLTSGTSGLGLISSSNFYVPQVNMPGSMASFVTPAGVTAAIPVVPTTATGMHGLGGPQFAPGLRTMRRIGRMR